MTLHYTSASTKLMASIAGRSSAVPFIDAPRSTSTRARRLYHHAPFQRFPRYRLSQQHTTENGARRSLTRKGIMQPEIGSAMMLVLLSHGQRQQITADVGYTKRPAALRDACSLK